MTPDSTGTQDLRTYLRIFWRWKLLFLALLVVIPAGAYGFEHGKPKVYQSSTLIELQGGSLNGVPVASGNIQAVARLVTTTPIATKAALLMNPPTSPGSIIGEVSALADVTTGFLTITVQDHDPNRAAAIANAFAKALGSYQTRQVLQTIDLQITALNKQLHAIPHSAASSRAPVVQQIAQLRAQRGATGGGAQVLQSAVADPSPVGPKTRRAVELAVVIALLLGIGAVLAAEHSDRRLRTPEDLEDLTGMPLLGVIPVTAFSPDSHPEPRNDEAFQMLRASLTYFNVNRPLTSVVIVSPLAADGKTTVAVGLAVATARAGKRAVLVDADLRRPQVCARLGVAPGDGLGDVLAGQRELSDVMFEHPVDAPEGGSLRVLPAGPLPPNPSALIASQAMRNVLSELEEQADLVIIDTAAALAVSDALPLLETASGIVMIVRMNRSSAAAVRRLLKVSSSAHGTVLGVVATGSSRPGAYGDAYGYYSQQRARETGPRWRVRRRKTQPSRAAGAGNSHVEPAPQAVNSATPEAGATANEPSQRGSARVPLAWDQSAALDLAEGQRAAVVGDDVELPPSGRAR
jgi:capsular exopolysaccharide synthesis family protein